MNHFTRYTLNVLVTNILLLILLLYSPNLADAQTTPTNYENEHVLGDENATVTIVEYASLNCPACALFHKDILPQLKKDYIETNQVKLVYRHFPLNQHAFIASVITECVPQEYFFVFVDSLYKNQKQWSSHPQPPQEVFRLAILSGIEQQTLETCLQENEKIQKYILDIRNDAITRFDAHSTPTVVINDQVLVGVKDYEVYTKIIDSLLTQ